MNYMDSVYGVFFCSSIVQLTSGVGSQEKKDARGRPEGELMPNDSAVRRSTVELSSIKSVGCFHPLPAAEQTEQKDHDGWKTRRDLEASRFKRDQLG